MKKLFRIFIFEIFLFFLIGRGSKISIEGKNLDSVYRTVVRFKPNESHLKPVTRVLWPSTFSKSLFLGINDSRSSRSKSFLFFSRNV